MCSLDYNDNKILDIVSYEEGEFNGFIITTKNREVIIKSLNSDMLLDVENSLSSFINKSIISYVINDSSDGKIVIDDDIKEFLGNMKSIDVITSKNKLVFRPNDSRAFVNVVFRDLVSKEKVCS